MAILVIEHPDAVREALRTLESYGGDAGPRPFETMARVLATVEAWHECHEAEERAHERRRDDPLRLAEARTILDQARHRAALRHVANGMRDLMAESFGTRHS